MTQTLDVSSIRPVLDSDRSRGGSIGFVPTMGALHEGHLSLIRRARAENDKVVVSIFVNPLQFGSSEDLASYPRDLSADARAASEAGADYLLAPTEQQMYPHGQPSTTVNVGRIGQICEGIYRPGHFNGVATVCTKLFNIVRCDRAYFGRKDAQQVAVIRQIVEDLNFGFEVVACPTVREADGLALSSRNRHLDEVGRAAATVLSQALFEGADLVSSGEKVSEKISRMISDRIAAEPQVRLEYVEVVDPRTFESVEAVDGPVTIALAAYVGGTRLIDNVTVP